MWWQGQYRTVGIRTPSIIRHRSDIPVGIDHVA